MKRVQLMLACVMAGTMGSAAAAPVGPGYLGDLVGQNVEIFNSIAGLGTSFSDIYSFDIGSFAAEAIATSVKVTLQFGSGSTPVYDISNFAIALKDVNDVQYAFDNTFNANGALELNAILAPSTVSAPGFYQFVVTGTTAGTAGGLYAGALSAAPVPEPKAWLLMLAGFGLVGLMVERAKRRPV